MNISIPENSILNHYNENTPPKEIFQEVCDLLGGYFTNRDFKYARSRPKITYEDDSLKIVIAFWSNYSNYAGGFVNLEIIGTVYSNKLAKIDKDSGSNRKGLLISHTFFTNRLNFNKPDGQVTVHLMDNTISAVRSEDLPHAIDKFNPNYNLYGITENNLNLVKEYIEKVYLDPMLRLKSVESFRKFIEKTPVYDYYKEQHARLHKYVELELENDPSLLKLLSNKGMIKA